MTAIQNERQTIKGADGVSLDALLTRCGKDGAPIVVLCHGFSGDKHEWGRFDYAAQALAGSGYDALQFDFTGHGENERRPVVFSQWTVDLEAVFALLRTMGYRKFGVIAYSFSSYALIHANLPRDLVCVLWAPSFRLRRNMYTWYLPRILTEALPWISLRAPAEVAPVVLRRTFFRELAAVDPRPALRRFNHPTLIVQGTKDNLVLADDVRRDFDALPSDDLHRYVSVDGAGHKFRGDHLARFCELSLAWLDEQLLGIAGSAAHIERQTGADVPVQLPTARRVTIFTFADAALRYTWVGRLSRKLGLPFFAITDRRGDPGAD